MNNNEPAGSSLLLAGVDIQALLDLSRQLSDSPEAAGAIQVSLQSGQLEDFFRLMRQRAQSIARGLDAQAALGTMTPAQAAPPPEPERGLVLESAKVTAPSAPEPGEPTLTGFFQTVTKSVVDAQSALDVQSLAYARQLKGTPLAPLHFSIPNVHAEVKMGFNVSDPANLVVRLFGKPEDTTNYGESTVSFDIAASPPPPGADFTSPVPMFLVVNPERERILNTAGIAEAQRPAAALFKNAAGEQPLYVAIAPHDNAVTLYRIASDEPPQAVDVGGGAAKCLADLAAAVNAWLASVTP